MGSGCMAPTDIIPTKTARLEPSEIHNVSREIGHIYIYIYIYVYIYIYIHKYTTNKVFAGGCFGAPSRRAGGSASRLRPPMSISFFLFDSTSRPFKFLSRLPGGCSGGEGTPPETLKVLTPNPYSQRRQGLNPGPSHPDPTS